MSPSSSSDSPAPWAYLPGEVWWVSFDPAVGPEVIKTRPAVVVSVPFVAALDLRVAVPILTRKDTHGGYPWLVPIAPTAANGLDRLGSADTSQLKSLSRRDRFKTPLGRLSPEDLTEVYAGIRLCLGLTDNG